MDKGSIYQKKFQKMIGKGHAIASTGASIGYGWNQEKNAEVDAAIGKICEMMKPEGSNKSRVTFYYLLAEHFGKLDELAG